MTVESRHPIEVQDSLDRRLKAALEASEFERVREALRAGASPHLEVLHALRGGPLKRATLLDVACSGEFRDDTYDRVSSTTALLGLQDVGVVLEESALRRAALRSGRMHPLMLCQAMGFAPWTGPEIAQALRDEFNYIEHLSSTGIRGRELVYWLVHQPAFAAALAVPSPTSGDALLLELGAHACVDLIALIHATGVPLNGRDHNGNTVLHRCAANGGNAPVQLMPAWALWESMGVDPRVRNEAGQTFMDLAFLRPDTRSMDEAYCRHWFEAVCAPWHAQDLRGALPSAGLVAAAERTRL